MSLVEINVEKLSSWHKTRIGLLAFTVVELAITYAFFSLSITSGTLLWYLITLIALIGGIKNLSRFIRSLIKWPTTINQN